MADDKAHKLVDWEDPGHSPGIGQKALDDGDFWFETGENPDDIKLVGVCPRCFARMDRVFPGDAVLSFNERMRRKKGPMVRVVDCQCGFKHPNAPADAPGCGMASTVKLAL